MRSDGLRTARWIALLLPLALMAGALGSQFIGHLVPCEMCVWQRWPHLAAIVLALLALVVKPRPARLALVVLAALAIGTSGAIGVAHAGVEYHWWPGFTPCTTQTRVGISIDELIRQTQAAPIVRCDVPQWTLFGISLAGFNAIISLASALVILVLAARGRRA